MSFDQNNIDIKLILDFKENGSEESLQKLFDKYKPLVNKVWRNYYLHDMDIDDWYQESMLVMVKNIRNYDPNHKATFGTLYQISLKNHLYDILRKRKAKKRMPVDKMVSYNANELYFQNSLKDRIFLTPDQSMNIKICYEELIARLSPLESEIAFCYLEDLINENNFSIDRLKMALARHPENATNIVDNCIARVKNKLKKIVKKVYD